MCRSPRFPLFLLLLIILLTGPAEGQTNGSWDEGLAISGFTYRNGTAITPAFVRAAARAGNYLYAGGTFTAAGGTVANGLARWDGKEWSSIPGFIGGRVNSLAPTADGSIYVAGSIQIVEGAETIRMLGRWDGSRWHRVSGAFTVDPPNVLPHLRSLVVDGDDLYVSGTFTHVDGKPAYGVARWDGSEWHALPSGMTETGWNMAIAARNGHIYVGGTTVQHWDGIRWTPLGSVINAEKPGEITSLLLDKERLIIGGTFVVVSGVIASGVAEWDGRRWRSLGAGVYMVTDNPGSTYRQTAVRVEAMTMDGGDLYVGGNFQMAGAGIEANNIARWDGTAWTSLRRGVDAPPFRNASDPMVASLLSLDGNLVVGGGFRRAGGSLATRGLALWSPDSGWSAPGTSAEGSLNAIVTNADTTFVGGDTATAAGHVVTHIGSFQDTVLSLLPEMNGAVYALAWGNGVLYAGGRFTSAGSIPRPTITRSIAKWNGSFWSILEDGPNHGIAGEVAAIAVDGDDIYAGGAFDSAAGRPAANIARWDGRVWHPLGSGLDGPVDAIAVIDGKIHAGGDFANAGGVPARGIAVWDGNSWSSLSDAALDGRVYTMARWGDSLLVGGEFTMAGGVPSRGIALLHDGRWSALGGDIDGSVRALLTEGKDLYIGGDFTHADGVVARNVALWRGGSWHPLGGGIDGRVNAIGTSARGIYFVGSFSRSGDIPVSNIARWLRTTTHEPEPAPALSLAIHAQPNPFAEATTITFSIPRGAPTTLEIFDMQGRRVATLIDDDLAAGAYTHGWEPGLTTGAGVYVYRLRSGGEAASGKLLLVR